MSQIRRPRTKKGTKTDLESPTTAQIESHGQMLAINTGVRLSCTMAAMISPFALFLCWSEREPGVIRRFAIQSSVLFVTNLLLTALVFLLTRLVENVPYFGFLLTLAGWLVYVAATLVMLYLRIKLMENAWRGCRHELPMLEGIARKFLLIYDRGGDICVLTRSKRRIFSSSYP